MERDQLKVANDKHQHTIATVEQSMIITRQHVDDEHERTIAELEQSVIAALQHVDTVATEKQSLLYQYHQVTSDHALAMVTMMIWSDLTRT